MSIPGWLQDHIDLYRKDPESGHMWDSTVVGGPGPVPCLLLTTTGRKSGMLRRSPLLYSKHDGGWIVVASNAGAPKHPAWYLNLQSKPETEIQVGLDVYQVSAKTVEGDLRQKMWDHMLGIWPFYPEYQERTDRVIPIVFLRPRS